MKFKIVYANGVEEIRDFGRDPYTNDRSISAFRRNAKHYPISRANRYATKQVNRNPKLGANHAQYGRHSKLDFTLTEVADNDGIKASDVFTLVNQLNSD